MDDSERMRMLRESLIDRERITSEDCRRYLDAGKTVFERGDTDIIQNLIQDFNYAQGQRNLCRLLLRVYFREGVEPEYEILGE